MCAPVPLSLGRPPTDEAAGHLIDAPQTNQGSASSSGLKAASLMSNVSKAAALNHGMPGCSRATIRTVPCARATSRTWTRPAIRYSSGTLENGEQSTAWAPGTILITRAASVGFQVAGRPQQSPRDRDFLGQGMRPQLSLGERHRGVARPRRNLGRPIAIAGVNIDNRNAGGFRRGRLDDGGHDRTKT
jgi:hypothetical protein